MAASSGAARPPLRSGAKIETFGTNFQDFCPYFFRFCPNPLDRWTIVFETGGSGTAEQGPQGRAEAKISAESIRLSRMLSGCRAEQKPPGAGRSSAGPQRAEQPAPPKDGRAFEPGPENPARGKPSERKDSGRPAGGRESRHHGQQRRLPPEPGEQILKTGYQSPQYSDNPWLSLQDSSMPSARWLRPVSVLSPC
ncbi:hypothetical protein [Sphingobacterium thalpophilum]|uniref:Uncharacterized protein n=2 Tax=Sphingobacterium thalpophilum TaxID=259 RepID=A0A4U9UK18_9SPHI|nr:hypothetical protein [Sphingobacterium thalpophilum]VTR33850.1 Uncharacterised protein [Sphingobacterium thalpophilum]